MRKKLINRKLRAIKNLSLKFIIPCELKRAVIVPGKRLLQPQYQNFRFCGLAQNEENEPAMLWPGWAGKDSLSTAHL